MLLIPANIFQPLIDVFEALLKAIHSVIGGSWGWSIVILTILVRAVLLPLTIKQFHSMQKLQHLQPQLKEIQNKYKDDKQRQQEEMMKFYRENQVNPFGSCLPLVAQLPVFIGLFYMLRTSLRADICPDIQRAHQHIPPGAPISHAHTVPCGPHTGAQFLFIPDLTNRATGVVLIVLLLLYVGTQLASSLMMSSPTMDKTQRQIMLFLPLVFVFIIINFPAGVIVYWITTNTWTMAQQYFIKRRIGPVTAPATAGPSTGGAGPGGGGGGGPGGDGRPSAPKNGQGSSGLGALLRGRPKADEEPAKEPVGAGARPRPARTSAPPPPPRKKKKRSGRRR